MFLSPTTSLPFGVHFVNMRLSGTCVLLGLLVLTLRGSAESLQTVVRPDQGPTVTISTELPDCTVCTISGVNDTEKSCHSSLALVPEQEAKLLFDCPQPLDEAFVVLIAGAIECTSDACSPTTVEAQPSFLTEFPRTFTWELKAPKKTVVALDILGEGLAETSQLCPGGMQYSVAHSKADSSGTQYCTGGSVTRLHLADQAVVTLQVQPKAPVSVLFQTSAGPLKGRTMAVSVDSTTTVAISRAAGQPECEVCSVDGSTPSCSPAEKTLTSGKSLSLEFSCPKPENVYAVKIKKMIECTESLCTPAAAGVDPELFKGFQRSLTWQIDVPDRTVLSLLFTDGLKEMSAGEQCQGDLKYTVTTTRGEGIVKTNSYCKGGALRQLDLLGATTVTTEVPKDREPEAAAFGVTVAPRGSRKMDVTPDPNTLIIITSTSPEPDCSVCTTVDSKQKCNPRQLRLSDPSSVEFTCPEPQNVFSVEINRELDCIEPSCSTDIVQAGSPLFSDFNRTFTWDLKVDSSRAFQLDLPETGMQQIPNGETCPNDHTYSVIAYLRTGPATVGTYCKGGTVTSVMARYKGRLSLRVPGNTAIDPVAFKFKVGPEVTSTLAIVKVTLPRGVSETEFIAANYPSDFPDDEQMRWDFTVPGMHNYSMHFVDHTAPECLSKEVQVEYHREGKKVTKASLTDRQPEHQQGDFHMVLKNCQTNTTLPGLTLKYKVSVMRSGHPVLCTVDLSKHKGVSLLIEKVGSDPYCEMSVESVEKKTVEVAAGTKASLSFLDCPNEDVRLTASKVISCQNMASCTPSLLSVPKLDACLPMPLHNFTWHLSIPKDGTLDLTSPTGSLQQSLPGQECNQSISLHVAERGGAAVGQFCFHGAIQKIQAHTNLSVTAKARDFNRSRGPFLNVSFSEEIPETFIYRVTPRASSPTLVAAPNWPHGMAPFSTVSWIVTLPSQYQAALQFVNISQPKCKDRHTSIKVKMLGQEEEIMSRREDEEAEDRLDVPQSFYLNMSNCIPEEGRFGAVAKISLQKKSNLLAIALGIAGALLLLVITLAVVCVVTKKRSKARKDKEASIYMGKGNIFRPNDGTFPKTRSDNESHVYDSIDETMVYGHLLRGSSYSDSLQDHYNGPQADSYQTFTGRTDPKLPAIVEPDGKDEPDHYKTFLDPSQSFHPPRPRTPIDRQDSMGFEDSRMVDNELYTFKSTGDINTIRLSGVYTDDE